MIQRRVTCFNMHMNIELIIVITSGGAYGVARVTLGVFPGYLVACCDSIESVLYVATSAVALGQMITTISHGSASLEPIYWCVIYISALLIQGWGGHLFWKVNLLLAFVSLGIIIIYVLGSIQFADFSHYANWDAQSGESGSHLSDWFRGGMYKFMRIFPLPCWFFIGVESISIACKDTNEPKKTVPVGYLACITTLVVTCLGVLFISCSISPGVSGLASDLTPLNHGFKQMFQISDVAATALSIPATYATVFGFMFCYGRQLRAMGRSGLLNPIIGQDSVHNTPVAALLFGIVVGYIICLIVYFIPAVGNCLFDVCALGAFSAYLAQFGSFIFTRRNLPTINKEFISPLGVYGALYGATVFILAFVSVCAFQRDFTAVIVFIVMVAVAIVYYVLVVQHRQILSDEENKVLFQAYLLRGK